jgi:hypothetical protein
MEANLLPANAESSELTADEMDLVSGGDMLEPWVKIFICADGSWSADFIGGTRVNSSPNACADAALPPR